MAMKIVLKLDLHDDKDKQKALKAVSSLQGLDAITVDMKDQKLTVVGSADPVDVVGKLRKFPGAARIVSVGPAKEEKKDEKKPDDKKPADPAKPPAVFYPYHPYQYQYVVRSAEEDPNSCVIC